MFVLASSQSLGESLPDATGQFYTDWLLPARGIGDEPLHNKEQPETCGRLVYILGVDFGTSSRVNEALIPNFVQRLGCIHTS